MKRFHSYPRIVPFFGSSVNHIDYILWLMIVGTFDIHTDLISAIVKWDLGSDTIVAAILRKC
jgi:hypothetical protein